MSEFFFIVVTLLCTVNEVRDVKLLIPKCETPLNLQFQNYFCLFLHGFCMSVIRMF